MQIVTATQARRSFFSLLEQIQHHHAVFAIEKRGVVVAYLSSQAPTMTAASILDFAGVWGKLTNKDWQAIDRIYRRRKSPPQP